MLLMALGKIKIAHLPFSLFNLLCVYWYEVASLFDILECPRLQLSV